MTYISYIDIIVVPIYFAVLYFIVNAIRVRTIRNPELHSYFMGGFILKLLSGISFTLFYYFYLNEGDMFEYFQFGMILNKIFYHNPSEYFSLLVTNIHKYNPKTLSDYGFEPWTFQVDRTFSVLRIVSIMIFFGFNRLLLTTMFISAICYIGVWKIFLVFYNSFPQLKRKFAVTVLGLPSLLFHTSVILKESFIFFAIGCILFSLYKIVSRKEKIWYFICVLIGSVFLLITIKPYFFYPLLIASILYIAIEALLGFHKFFYAYCYITSSLSHYFYHW